jgi:hypothetical protein
MLGLKAAHEAARVHHACQRRGHRVAARCARAAIGDAGRWIPQQQFARRVCVNCPHRQFEHDVRRPHAANCADHLDRDVKDSHLPGQLAPKRECNRDSRIEMRARNRTKRQDEDGEYRAGRNRVAQERNRAVALRQLERHYAGADHGREQKGRSESLARNPLRE